MGENFAFFLPIMMASFGIAFLIVWGWGARGAGWWSGAFFCVAGGFAVPVAFQALPTHLWGIVADLLFATGFLLFSQALLDRWRRNWMLRLRIAIWGGSILLCGLALWTDNLPLELVSSDFGCFLLISLPLVAAHGQLRRAPDRALYAAAVLVALDNLVRGSSVSLTLPGGVPFRDSEYAFLMQALACMFGLFLALSALAACVLDLLARYRHDAHVDPLSGLLNRRGFDELVVRQRRKGGSLIACDIDHFKSVNDAHGHALGDRVIVTLADMLRTLAPANSIIARFGGEEFILFLPATDAATAAPIADAVRLHFAEQGAARLGLPRPLTASFGLTTLHRADPSIHDAIARADSALYEAKETGRNRLCVRRALAMPDAVPATDGQLRRA
ncbi:GGDEF domain-containing protein [Sphingobium sp. YR768]|uniref:GGDEF domain-containing protein n=1 Tax=Sphingobium sp. YR768 TaxID=1884365 RepID=UPI0008D3D0FE|nr:GGDEF domain-containing protein [Sphingobium sp. YR768]SEQ87691.1 diguanylate cyclase (GGDEF) domain-containing protein [Sphingobium sp. YR768]